MRVRFVFAWFDAWIGVYWDRERRRLYILPIPCVGVVIQFRSRPIVIHKELAIYVRGKFLPSTAGKDNPNA